MNAPQNPEVIVVGAGPVGLVAACELARRGVRIRIIGISRIIDEDTVRRLLNCYPA